MCWSREEPRRVGEIAPLEGAQILGRGAARPDDGAPRVQLHRQRPSRSEPTGPLESPRISRVQLALRTTADKLEVESIGRCPLLVDGEPCTRGELGPGDTIQLQGELVLLVVKRPRALPPLRSWPDELTFPFGEADPHGLVGESPAAWRLREAIAFAARSAGHVMVRGESGTGKELAARAVHALSRRAGRPFVARNAATIPAGLVDAELFGNAKNYPNPGTAEREGLIGEAHGGTLFLDEIGELPAHHQAHLLRVLDAGGEYQRLGEARAKKADLRVVAATNRSFTELKHDFLARLTLRIEMPSFDDRREDVPLVARHVLRRAAAANEHVARTFFTAPPERGGEARLAPDLIDGLVRHRYHHHAREIEQLLWRALAESPGGYLELTEGVARELERTVQTTAQPAELTRPEVEAALTAHGGNITRAARALGLKNRFALYRLMKKHGLAGAPEPESDGD